MIKSMLVANRSEIAIRVFRACTEMGIRTIAVYSAADRLSLHRYKADEAYEIGQGKSPVAAYLDMDSILAVARQNEVDAIHPGYGFLAENAEFARRCQAAGIIFVGPSPEHLELFGNKLRAREAAAAAGLRVIPGTDKPVSNYNEILAFAREHGFPVLLKAAAGGGGRGQRIAYDEKSLPAAFDLAAAEAEKAFGDPSLYVEKLLQRPRHIEVQVIGDGETAVHLFERDCSVQRRHQKLVEFAPSLALDEQQRTELCRAACNLLAGVGYKGVGTVEFLLDENGHAYFLEVNPRIQVEHTVTEMITGIDIVQAQIKIAAGQRLREIGLGEQASIKHRGYAIQCRVTTEDPLNDFAPDTGRLLAYRTGAGFGIRLDEGNGFPGAEIGPYYDSLLVKIISYAPTLPMAAAKMVRSLREFRIRGVKTNIPFLENVVQHPVFLAGEARTDFVDSTPELFIFRPRLDRGTRLLRFIAHVSVNGGPGLGAHTKRPPLRSIPEPRPRAGSKPEPSLRRMLLEGGPGAVVDWIRRQQRLLVTDTTFRDAHQSLLATRVRTRDLEKVAPATVSRLPGLFSLEVWGGATFDVCMRFLQEDPWQRLRTLRELMPDHLLQMLMRGSNGVGYTSYPDSVIRRFIRAAANNGIDILRIFDSLNWLPNLEVALDEALSTGKLVEGTICYTGDIDDPERDKYPLKYYVNMAKELERRGVHLLGIKDMAGLLKPYAAARLVKALREEVGLPIHLHTHDLSGNGVATILMAAEAGVDIVDLAIPALSGLTSQPSMGAVAAALKGHPRDPEIDVGEVIYLSNYWEAVRERYTPFESGLRATTPDVYQHEMPGGQYSNLRIQASSLGLAERWLEIKRAYQLVNVMLGDIVKVTPSSKMVGDFALFLVQHDLVPARLLEDSLSYTELEQVAAEVVSSLKAGGQKWAFPDSVVEFFSGGLGQPPGGFPEELQRLVVGHTQQVTQRPGAGLPEIDWDKLAVELADKWGLQPSDEDLLSAVLYPRVFDDFQAQREAYGDVSVLETETFFYGMRPGEVTLVEIDKGKTLIVELKAIGEAESGGRRTVYFELNGQPREVQVRDLSIADDTAPRPQADRSNPEHVAAGMSGKVVKVLVEVGDAVRAGQHLAVTEAMKLETTIVAPHDGTVTELYIAPQDQVVAGELLAVVKRN